MKLKRREPKVPEGVKPWDLDIIVDGDTLLYKAAMACQYNMHEVYRKGARTRLKEFRKVSELKEFMKQEGLVEGENCRIKQRPVLLSFATAKHIADNFILKFEEHFNKSCVLIFSGKDNFREVSAMEQPYKGSRWTEERRQQARSLEPQWSYWLGLTEKSHVIPEIPEHKEALKAYLIARYPSMVINGGEADDALGIYQTNNVNTCLMIKEDKDLDMIPGYKFNPYSIKEEPVYFVEELEGYRNFYKQLITGDRVDNIPGIDGAGPKKAEELLNGCITRAEMESAVFTEYEKVYGEEAYKLLVSRGQLLWIMREDGRIWVPDLRTDASF